MVLQSVVTQAYPVSSETRLQIVRLTAQEGLKDLNKLQILD